MFVPFDQSTNDNYSALDESIDDNNNSTVDESIIVEAITANLPISNLPSAEESSQIDFINQALTTNNFDMLNQQQKTNILTLQNYLGLFLNQIRHGLSNSAVVDIAAMQNISSGQCEESEKFCKSYQTMCKRAKVFKPKLDKYFYCHCGVIGPIEQHELANKIQCKQCKVSILPIEIINSANSFSYFCYTKLGDYLKYLLPRIYKFLRFNRPQTEDIFDLTDGSEYRRLAGDDTLVIYFGFDGAKYSDEKGGKSMWPLVIYICELPFDLRIRFAFPIAVHSGPNQPTCHMLQPFVDELLHYSTEPLCIELDSPSGPTEKKLYVKLLLGICDAPGRAKVLNTVSHNGTHGCNLCLIESHRDTVFKCPVYPLQSEYAIRTDEDWRRIAKEADAANSSKPSSSKQKNILGIKGSCPFLKLPYVDIVALMPPDYMHGQFLGTARLMLDCLTGTESRSKRKLNKDQIELINNRLKLIKFPAKCLRQMPSDITTKLKAFEIENLLFYGIIIFSDILKKEEFQLFSLLSYIIASLTSRRISHSQINETEKLITVFMQKYCELYRDEPFMLKYNAHLLSHTPNNVRQFGPLITSSSYQVEHLMGELGKMVQTATKVNEQLMKKAITFQSIVVTFMTHFDQFTAPFKQVLLKFYPALLNSTNDSFNKFRESTQKHDLNEVEFSLLPIDLRQSMDTRTVQKVDIIYQRNFYICSNKYNYRNANAMTTTDNQFIKTKSGKYCMVENIFKVGNDYFMFCLEHLNVRKYPVYENLYSAHLKLSNVLSSKLLIVTLDEIECSFSRVFFNGTFYILDLFNKHR